MRTRTFNVPVPTAPANWPSTGNSIKPVKRRFPNSLDEPQKIGYYLEPFKNISERPDREDFIKQLMSETIV